MSLLSSALLVVLQSTGAIAAPDAGSGDGVDWPQWRGPERSGVSQEIDWDPVGRTDLLWSAEIGIGHSSFAVADGAVYALGFTPDDEKGSSLGADRLTALDLATGAIRWTATWRAERLDNSHEGGTLTTPTIVGAKVVVAGRNGVVRAFATDDGAALWSVDLASELDVARPTWGFASSPVVSDGSVIVSLGRTASLSLASGEIEWASTTYRGSAYSTPTPFEREGIAYLAVLQGEGLSVLGTVDGDEVAFHRWDARPQVAPMTPVVAGDTIVISGGYGRGVRGLSFDGTSLRLAWSGRTMRNKMSGCVLWNGHLYGFDESVLECMDLDGEVMWRQRGLGTGSLSLAGGRLVILDGHGQLVIALATPLAYTELSRREIFNSGTFWSTPVLSHGRVVCRSSAGQMACVDHRAGPDRTKAEGRAANQRLAAALLNADEIFARHAAAVDATADPAGAPDDLASLSMTGQMRSLRNTVREGSITLRWARGTGFEWCEGKDVGPGALVMGHDIDRAWTVGLHLNTRALEGEALDALREAGSLDRLRDPATFYPRRAVLGVRLFDHRSCYVVAATTAKGNARKLYFEVDTGLLAGHEGSATDLWTYDRYREVGGRLVPTEWSFYDADTGEMTNAAFDAASANWNGAFDAPIPPKEAALLLRSEAEVQRMNTVLKERFGDVVGEWWPAEPTADNGVRRFWIERGFLTTDRPSETGNYWVGPDPRGRMTLLGAANLSFLVERDEGGRAVAIQVFNDEAARMRLVRRP